MSEKISDVMLEKVDSCPICDSAGTAEVSGVYDWMFGSCSNEWRYMKCIDCDSLYLSPRLLDEHISIAYSKYYTHADADTIVANSKKKSLKLKLLNSYIASSEKSNFIDALKRVMLYPIKNFLAAKSRHISELTPGSVLDFGCGNGEFMLLSKSFGWETKGYDLDESAVFSARKLGLDVSQGGISDLINEESDKYDLITLSHVIEHVYEPHKLIQECYRLLKPGGRLWLETPNSRSLGLTLFGKYWRGLEPPRHIVLFNFNSMSNILLSSGFSEMEKRKHPFSSTYMSVKSERNRMLSLSSGQSVTKMNVVSLARLSVFSFFIEVTQSIFQDKSEFITVIAVK